MAAATDAAVLARYHNPVLVNVGANKGYAAAEFLAIWSQRRVNSKIWLNAIKKYAGIGTAHVRGFLGNQPCGVCGACKTPTPAKHERHGGSVHMLELLAANRDLLHNLTRETAIDDIARVHNLAASNRSHRVYANPRAFAGTEYVSASASKRREPPNQEAISLDEFFEREALKEAYLVSIDVEGWDALVLEGMAGLLRRGQVAFLEFEVGKNKGYWRADHPEQRRLDDTISSLAAAGYACFMEAGNRLAPISGPCWRDAFNSPPWANVLCARAVTPALDVLLRVARASEPM